MRRLSPSVAQGLSALAAHVGFHQIIRSSLRAHRVVATVVAAALILVPALGYTQSRSALARYGSYPLQGQGLRRFTNDLRKAATAMRKAKLRCRSSISAKKLPLCDFDHDHIPNGLERSVGLKINRGDTDHDRLSDRVEILTYHTNPLRFDTDGDGRGDGDEILIDHTNPLFPGDETLIDCSHPAFSESGDTAAFGIPSGYTGNVARGQQIFNGTCNLCHGAAEPGTTLTFPSLKLRISQAPMFITRLNDAALADLVAYLHRSETGLPAHCPAATPTPAGSASPSPTPTTPSTGCANEYFDASGNTLLFGIPTPYVGNIGQGQAMITLACSGCHTERGTGHTFAQIKSAVTGPLMNIQSISDQQFANLAAYLNRSFAAQNCGTPPPTPTPLDDISAGTLVFQGTCQSCHRSPRELRRLTSRKLHEALREVSRMNAIQITSEQERVLLIYLNSL